MKHFAIGSSLMALLLGPAHSHAAPVLGRVHAVEGVAHIARVHAGGTGAKPQSIKKGDAIHAGDRVETGRASNLTVVLQDGSVRAALLVKPDSSLRLANEPGQAIEVRLEKGAVLSDIHNPDFKRRPQPFRVRTRTAVMGVRGTVFFVKAEAGAPDFLCTCAGKVHVEHDKFGAVDIESKHHDAPKRIFADQPGNWLMPAPMGEDHVDAEAAALEKALASSR